jgi:KDO2-lipid IV(A) lauroyltransferase
MDARMPLINLKYRLEYGVVRTVAWLVGRLPLETASDLSGRIWRWIAPFLGRHDRAMAHLAAAFPDMSEAERQRLACDMWEVLGRTFAETFYLPEICASDRVDSSEVIEPLRAHEGQGMVICAAHQGNWEVATMGLMRLGKEPAGLYQRVKNPLVDAFVRETRGPYYPAGLFAKDPNTAMKLMRLLKRGGCLAMLADLRESSGVQVPFFGRNAPSTPFPAMMARNLGIPLFAGRIVREPGVRFRLSMEKIEVPVTEDKDADILAATANLQAAFERSIRAHPEQWMWAHQRWG